MIIADQERSHRLRRIKQYRDLRTYEVKNINYALSQKEAIKDRFSKQRWETFRHDVDYFLKKNAAGSWSYFFIDHGYNPPPTWTIVGGTLSKYVPVEHVKLLTMIDFVLVVFMFAVIAYVYNTETMLFSLLFFLCTFSGRWPVLGQSLLRFDWLVALVIAACMLKIKRHGWVGALFVYSSLTRVFPTIFLWPYGVVVLYHLITERRFAREHLRFLLGALFVIIILVGGALLVLGPNAFVESKNNLLMHGSTQSYSSHRVGLGDALFYRGEMTKDDLRNSGGILSKAENIADIQSLLYGLGILLLVFVAFYAVRTKRPVYELIYLSIVPLFCMQTPQINYYNMRILLILNHVYDFGKARNKIGLILLFMIEIATQYSHVCGNWRYTTTCITSIGLVIYFIILLVFLAIDFANTFRNNTKQIALIPEQDI
jgi:hypothetical protein